MVANNLVICSPTIQRTQKYPKPAQNKPVQQAGVSIRGRPTTSRNPPLSTVSLRHPPPGSPRARAGRRAFGPGLRPVGSANPRRHPRTHPGSATTPILKGSERTGLDASTFLFCQAPQTTWPQEVKHNLVAMDKKKQQKREASQKTHPTWDTFRGQGKKMTKVGKLKGQRLSRFGQVSIENEGMAPTWSLYDAASL